MPPKRKGGSSDTSGMPPKLRRRRGTEHQSSTSQPPSHQSPGPSKHQSPTSQSPSHQSPGPSYLTTGPSHQSPGPSNLPTGPSYLTTGPSYLTTGPNHQSPGPSYLTTGPSHQFPRPSQRSMPILHPAYTHAMYVPFPQPVPTQATAPFPQPVPTQATAPYPQPVPTHVTAPYPQPVPTQAPFPQPVPTRATVPFPQPVPTQAPFPQPVPTRATVPFPQPVPTQATVPLPQPEPTPSTSTQPEPTPSTSTQPDAAPSAEETLSSLEADVASRLEGRICAVCGDKANGKHYLVMSCEGCKGFFKRTNKTNPETLAACNKSDCEITVANRKGHPRCRLKKCFAVGMSADVGKGVRNRINKAARERKEKALKKQIIRKYKNIKCKPKETEDMVGHHTSAFVRAMTELTDQDNSEWKDDFERLAVILGDYWPMFLFFAARVPGFAKLNPTDQRLCMSRPFMTFLVCQMAFRAAIKVPGTGKYMPRSEYYLRRIYYPESALIAASPITADFFKRFFSNVEWLCEKRRFTCDELALLAAHDLSNCQTKPLTDRPAVEAWNHQFDIMLENYADYIDKQNAFKVKHFLGYKGNRFRRSDTFVQAIGLVSKCNTSELTVRFEPVEIPGSNVPDLIVHIRYQDKSVYSNLPRKFLSEAKRAEIQAVFDEWKLKPDGPPLVEREHPNYLEDVTVTSDEECECDCDGESDCDCECLNADWHTDEDDSDNGARENGQGGRRDADEGDVNGARENGQGGRRDADEEDHNGARENGQEQNGDAEEEEEEDDPNSDRNSNPSSQGSSGTSGSENAQPDSTTTTSP